MSSQKIFTIVLGGLILGLIGMSFLSRSGSAGVPDGKYDEFAQCLTEQGAIFYGTFWCPHCKNQKELFGSAIEYVNYIECSSPDGRSQTAQCEEAGITGYPTWKFSDGSEFNGEVSLSKLANKTGCELPLSDDESTVQNSDEVASPMIVEGENLPTVEEMVVESVEETSESPIEEPLKNLSN